MGCGHPSDYGYDAPTLSARLLDLTRATCALLKRLETMGVLDQALEGNEKLRAWWLEHKAIDEERARIEREESHPVCDVCGAPAVGMQRERIDITRGGHPVMGGPADPHPRFALGAPHFFCAAHKPRRMG